MNALHTQPFPTAVQGEKPAVPEKSVHSHTPLGLRGPGNPTQAPECESLAIGPGACILLKFHAWTSDLINTGVYLYFLLNLMK